MLLCKATIGGTLYRFSDRWMKLDHSWKRKILSFSSPTLDLSTEHGGRLALSDGTITFSADFHAYPPPLTIDMELRRWETAETGELMFDGTASLESFGVGGATYRLYAPVYDQEIADAYPLSGTIVTAFTAGAAALGLTLDYTGARSPAPAIAYTTTTAAKWVDILASIAATYTHLWWIDKVAGKLYLRAMENYNGSRSVGRRFFQPGYRYSAPVSEVTSTVADVVYRAVSANGVGKIQTLQSYHTTGANIEAELALALAALNGLTMEVSIPIADGVPAPNEKIIAVDRKTTPNLNVWCYAQRYNFDFKTQIVTVSGKGGVSAI